VKLYKTADVCTIHYDYFQKSRIAYSLCKKPQRNYQDVADVKLL